MSGGDRHDTPIGHEFVSMAPLQLRMQDTGIRLATASSPGTLSMRHRHETNRRTRGSYPDSRVPDATWVVSAFYSRKAPPQYIVPGGANRPPPFRRILIL